MAELIGMTFGLILGPLVGIWLACAIGDAIDANREEKGSDER